MRRGIVTMTAAISALGWASYQLVPAGEVAILVVQLIATFVVWWYWIKVSEVNP